MSTFDGQGTARGKNYSTPTCREKNRGSTSPEPRWGTNNKRVLAVSPTLGKKVLPKEKGADSGLLENADRKKREEMVLQGRRTHLDYHMEKQTEKPIFQNVSAEKGKKKAPEVYNANEGRKGLRVLQGRFQTRPGGGGKRDEHFRRKSTRDVKVADRREEQTCILPPQSVGGGGRGRKASRIVTDDEHPGRREGAVTY